MALIYLLIEDVNKIKQGEHLVKIILDIDI